MKRLLFFVVFMSLGTALLYLIVRIETGEREVSIFTEEAPRNVLDMTDVAIRHLEGERLHWELWADHAVVDERQDTATLNQVRFHVYERNEDGTVQDIIRGRSLQAFLRGGGEYVVLEREVLLTKGEGLEIRSERVEYDQSEARITIPTHVVVRTPSGFHEGESLIYTLTDERMTFTEPRFYQ